MTCFICRSNGARKCSEGDCGLCAVCAGTLPKKGNAMSDENGFEFAGSKSPCCDVETWDLDCPDCESSGEDLNGGICHECEGLGYIEGWRECSECGDTFDENDCT